MRALLDDLLTAFGMLTRLPVPERELHEAPRHARSVWAYPLVGAAIGALSALVWFVAQFAGLGSPLAAGLAIAFQILFTGAIHEDGLADFADGLGARGGPEAALAVMRDSRIGTYGVIALMLIVGLRWGGVARLALHSVLAGLVCSALLGKIATVALVSVLSPVRTDGLGSAVANPPLRAVVAAFALALVIVAVTLPVAAAVAAFGAAAAAVGVVSVLAGRKIGGYTGDVLGAGEQLAQTAVLLVLAAAI